MRQEHFEIQNRKLWNEFNIVLKEIKKFPSQRSPSKRVLKLPFLYRQICNHYALAMSREYSPALVEYLHSMALEGHQHIYRYHAPWFIKVIDFLYAGFPRSLRKNLIYFVIAVSVFLLPAILTGYSCYHRHEFIYSILDDHQIAQIEYMYDPSNRKLGRTESRGSDTNVAMFGFYIKNNTGIGFRTFASGILAGIGTLFFLLYNGILLGGIAGYITRLGFIDTFWPFVSGHGAFELTAIVISGASGLMLAHAIIAPGNQKRIQKLKQIAPDALKLITGAAIMFFIAAFIEAFWSPSSVSVNIKYMVAAVLWLLVAVYFVFAGSVKAGK
jgi:uncharacterized membrane protein SpoIIM required for sporulation